VRLMLTVDDCRVFAMDMKYSILDLQFMFTSPIFRPGDGSPSTTNVVVLVVLVVVIRFSIP